MDSASLKINRASKHIVELNDLFLKKRPFTYILETNVITGQRATFAKRIESVANDAAIIIGDIIHNLRASIDHAYWDVLNPLAETETEERSIQFPIKKTRVALEESLRAGLPSRLSEEFIQAIIGLNPFREPGGNEALCAIHDLDIADKHKLLIPTGNYTRITSEIIQRQVPAFPSGLVNCGFGQGRRDVVWLGPTMNRLQRRCRKIPKNGILEKEIDVPVDIVFAVDGFVNSKPVVATLNELVDTARTTVNTIQDA